MSIRFFFRTGGNEVLTISAEDLDDLDFAKSKLDFNDEHGTRHIVYTAAVSRIVIS